MKSSLAVAIVATGLLVSGSAFAQQGYPQPYPDNGYNQPGQYDYARVIRVDPVYDSRYSTASNNQRCRQQPVAYGNGPVTGGQYPNNGYYPNNNGYYGNAQGGAYDPYSGQPRYGSQVARNVATVVGGIAGAVIGSKVGGGTGSYAASALGSMVGGMAGRGIYDRVQQNRYYGDRTGTVTVCDPEPVRGTYAGNGGTTAYDVTYEYAGRQYVSRMNYHPGDRVRVRVDVTPQ